MAEPLKRPFTTVEYHTMLEAGILQEDDRIELIEGEIWQMPAIRSKHVAGVVRLDRIFQRGLGDDVLVFVQNPIHLSDLSEPEPDLAVVRFRSDAYESSLPTPEDVHFLVEVADTSLVFDRETKMGLYARHGISEAWLVNLVDSVVAVYRDPLPRGYRQVRACRRGERLSPLAFPDFEIPVDAILG